MSVQPLEQLTFELTHAGVAMEALARAAGIETDTRASVLGVAQDAGEQIDAQAAWLGLEAVRVDVLYADAGAVLRAAAPAIVKLPGGRLLALAGARGTQLRIIGPDHRPTLIAAARIEAALRAPAEASQGVNVDLLLAAAELPPRRVARVRAALLAEPLRAHVIASAWLLRAKPGASFLAAAKRAGVLRQLGLVGIAHTAQYALGLIAWWTIGKGVLAGRLDRGWLYAWFVLLLSVIPFRLLTIWLAERAAIGGGALLKQRLLAGALRLEPSEVRKKGTGQFLGEVIESQTVESQVIGGAITGLLSIIELVVAAVILALGAGGLPQAVLLLAWVVIAAFLVRAYHRSRRAWTAHRLQMTHHLTEQMLGHRTRIAQDLADSARSEEDRLVADHLRGSEAMDRADVLLSSFLSRGWLVVGILGLYPAFLRGSSPEALAIGLGGILLAQRAFGGLSGALARLVEASIAWETVASLFRAAERPDPPGAPSFTEHDTTPGSTLLELRGVQFRHPDRAESVLRGCTLEVKRAERVLLQGPSGAGKSTLGSLISGLQLPSSGLVLLDGLDRHTLGREAWRRKVVAAPQFHENHIVTATLAFNLLMGRRWPPEAEDLDEAYEVCRELQLTAVIDRMPSGLHQIVGETGWQLSHGERSRVYIARALLQHGELVVLDESFGALDPETLEHTLRCVLRRAKTLIVIAHP